MKKLILSFGIMVISVFILTGCATKTQEPTINEISSKPAGLIAEGRLMPVNSMDQSFSIPGQVSEILVRDGEAVKAGQVLARLQSSPEANLALARAHQEALAAQQSLDELKSASQVNLMQGRLAVINAQKSLDMAQEDFDADGSEGNKAALDAAQAAFDRAQEMQAALEEGKGVDADQLALAEAQLETANAAITSVQATLDALELKATMDGSVVDMNLQVGQRVSAGQPVLTLADFSNWIVKTDNLTEGEVVNLQNGQNAEITLDALPETILIGEVTHVNTRYEEKRGDITYTVTLALQQIDPAMRWGMTAAIKFIP